MCENYQSQELQSQVDCFPDSTKSSHGRWTKEEHTRFMEGIRLYGKNWKKVEEFIGTRTGAQIRSHAQKVFNRPDKMTKDDILIKDNSEQFPEQTISPLIIGQPQGKIIQDQVDHQSSNALNKKKKIETIKAVISTSTTPQQSGSYSNLKPSTNHHNRKSNKISQKTFLKTLQQLEQSYKHAQKQEQQNSTQPNQKQSSPYQYLHSSYPKSISSSPLTQTISQSPADFIDQSSLSTIFEPADIQTHLLQFYVAQVSLENMMMMSQSKNQLENPLLSQSPLQSQISCLVKPQDKIQPISSTQQHVHDKSLTSSARSSNITVRTSNSIQNSISSNYQHNNNMILKEQKHDCLMSMNHYQEDSNSSDNSNSLFPANQQDVETQLLSLFLTHFQQSEGQQQQQQQQQQPLIQQQQQHTEDQLIPESAELQALMQSLLQSQKEQEIIDKEPLGSSQESQSWESECISDESCSSNLSDSQSQLDDVSNSENITSQEQ